METLVLSRLSMTMTSIYRVASMVDAEMLDHVDLPLTTKVLDGTGSGIGRHDGIQSAQNLAKVRWEEHFN